MASIGGIEIPPKSLASFHEHLKKSKRVLALLGAGLSASSGLPTFRGAGGLWRTHQSVSLASPQAFRSDPGLVWQFYSYRRHMALSVEPNPAHFALAELSRRMPQFMTLTQNVDGLSPRAGHPMEQLKLLHGSLFEVKCTDKACGYSEANFVDPIVPALAIPTDGKDPTSNEARKNIGTQLRAKQKSRELDISDANVRLPSVPIEDLPQCPKCRQHILRPAVVWFGESLPMDVIGNVLDYINEPEPIDLMLVIGTSSQVYPAAGYVDSAQEKGAKICVVNMEAEAHSTSRYDVDWYFQGDAATLLPELLKPVIGTL